MNKYKLFYDLVVFHDWKIRKKQSGFSVKLSKEIYGKNVDLVIDINASEYSTTGELYSNDAEILDRYGIIQDTAK